MYLVKTTIGKLFSSCYQTHYYRILRGSSCKAQNTIKKFYKLIGFSFSNGLSKFGSSMKKHCLNNKFWHWSKRLHIEVKNLNKEEEMNVIAKIKDWSYIFRWFSAFKCQFICICTYTYGKMFHIWFCSTWTPAYCSMLSFKFFSRPR